MWGGCKAAEHTCCAVRGVYACGAGRPYRFDRCGRLTLARGDRSVDAPELTVHLVWLVDQECSLLPREAQVEPGVTALRLLRQLGLGVRVALTQVLAARRPAAAAPRRLRRRIRRGKADARERGVGGARAGAGAGAPTADAAFDVDASLLVGADVDHKVAKRRGCPRSAASSAESRRRVARRRGRRRRRRARQLRVWRLRRRSRRLLGCHFQAAEAL